MFALSGARLFFMIYLIMEKIKHKKELKDLIRTLKKGDLESQKQSIKNWIDSGETFNNFIAITAYETKESLLGVILNTSKNWSELVFHCIDTYGLDPYAEINSSEAHCVLHKAVRKGADACGFLDEWSRRGLTVNPIMKVPSTPLGVVFNFFHYRMDLKQAAVANKLVELGADINATHTNVKRYHYADEWLQDAKPEPVWAFGLKSNVSDFLSIAIDGHIKNANSCEIKIKSEGKSDDILLYEWFNKELNIYWSHSKEQVKCQETLWLKLFPLFSKEHQDLVLRHAAKVLSRGNVSATGLKLTIERGVVNDDVATEIQNSMLDLMSGSENKSAYNRKEANNIRHAARFIIARGGFEAFPSAQEKRKIFKENFLLNSMLREDFLTLLKKDFDTELAIIETIEKIRHCATMARSGMIEKNAWQGCADFWVKRLIIEKNGNAELLKAAGVDIIESMNSVYTRDLHPMDTFLSCKNLITSLVKHKVLSYSKIQECVIKWEDTNKKELESRDLKQVKLAQEYKSSIERNVLLESVENNVPKKPKQNSAL